MVRPENPPMGRSEKQPVSYRRYIMNYQSGGIKRITVLLLAGAISAAAFAAESKERTIVFNEDQPALHDHEDL